MRAQLQFHGTLNPQHSTKIHLDITDEKHDCTQITSELFESPFLLSPRLCQFAPVEQDVKT